jgi:multidrug transporter EmrE-like cation transporter
MRSDVFLMVLFAAICHAGLNFFSRKTHGNLVVIWWALLAGCVMLLPLAVHALVNDTFHNGLSVTAVSCMIATGLIHFIYFLYLSRTYKKGEISVVYPIARGTGVGLTAILAFVMMKENISITGSIGIVLVLFWYCSV